MIDLHTHILPGIDDGAQDMLDALELAEIAFESGTEALVATPHSNQIGRFENYNTKEFRDIYFKFCKALEKERIPLKIYPGMEIFVTDDIAEKIENKVFVGLNHSQYYLVEFPFDMEYEAIRKGLKNILETGKTPLIAHPERYYCVQDFPAMTYEWIQMGCRTQVNRGSIFGKFGRQEERTADYMIENGLATCIASDAHGPYMRTTYMLDVKEYLIKYYGEDAAYWLLKENPERIIHNKNIPIHGRVPERKVRIFR